MLTNPKRPDLTTQPPKLTSLWMMSPIFLGMESDKAALCQHQHQQHKTAHNNSRDISCLFSFSPLRFLPPPLLIPLIENPSSHHSICPHAHWHARVWHGTHTHTKQRTQTHFNKGERCAIKGRVEEGKQAPSIAKSLQEISLRGHGVHLCWVMLCSTNTITSWLPLSRKNGRLSFARSHSFTHRFISFDAVHYTHGWIHSNSL